VLSEARPRAREGLEFVQGAYKEISMNDRKAEILYLRRRVADSLAMATAAAGPCAKAAHRTLARLYGEAIDTLAA